MRSIRVHLVVGLLLTVAGGAVGISRYLYVPLYDFGHGARAHGFLGVDPLFHPQQAVVGHVVEASGSTTACVWRGPDFDSLEPLQGLWGPNAEAYGGNLTDDGYEMIVGAAQNLSEVWKPILWRQQVGNWFLSVQLPMLGGTEGKAHDRVRGSDSWRLRLRALMVGMSTNSLGRRLPVLWLEDSAGAVTAVELPTLGGGEGYAYSLTMITDAGSVDRFFAVGTSKDSSNVWRAIIWAIDENPPGTGVLTSATQLSPPLSNGDQLYSIAAKGIGFSKVGFADLMDGTRRPMLFADASELFLLSTLMKKNGVARASDYAADGVCYVGGDVYDSGLQNAASVWTFFSELGRTRAYPAKRLTGSTSVPEFAQISGICDRMFAGSYWLSYPSSQGAMVLAPDLRQLPDMIDITDGGGLVTGPDETRAWFEDSESIPILSGKKSGGRATVVASFYALPKVGDGLRVTFRGRVLKQASPTGTVEFWLYNNSLGVWQLAASTSIGATFTTFQFSASQTNYVRAQDRRVLVRMNFIPGTVGSSSYAIDQVVLDPI